MSYTHSTLTESAIIAGLYESRLDEGLGDFLKKAVDKVKNISSAVKNFMLSKADAISAWTDKNIVEPLKKHLSSIVPGYSWGSNKNNDQGLITSVLQLLAKSSGVATESKEERFSDRKAQRVSEGVRKYIDQVSSSYIFEKKTVVESGAIGAVLSVIHWSHFSIDVLEALLKVAPSIPFLAGLINQLKNVEAFMKKNPKLSKVLDWYEHGTFTKWNIPVKDAINAICIAVGIVEILMGGGIWIILSTVGSAAWVIGEKIWHHYQKHDKEAGAIKESFLKRDRFSSQSRYFKEEIEDDDEDYDDDADLFVEEDDDIIDSDDLEDDDSDSIEIDGDEEDDELYTDDEDCDPDDEDCDDDDLDLEEGWCTKGYKKKRKKMKEEDEDDFEDESDLDDDCEDDEDCDPEEDYDNEDTEEEVVTESRIRRLERTLGRTSINESRRLKTESTGPFGKHLSRELELTPDEYEYLWDTIEDYKEQYGRIPKVRDIVSIVSGHPRFSYSNKQISELLKFV